MGIALDGVLAGVLLFLLAPVVLVVMISFTGGTSLAFPPPSWSFRWYHRFFVEDPSWMQATRLSLLVGVSSAALATTLATLAGLSLAWRPMRGQAVAEWVLLAPMIVPTIVAAIAFYRLFAALGLIGSPIALIVAHACLALPLAFLNIVVHLRTIDPRLLSAAASLGAGPVEAFRRVTFPLLVPGLIAAALLAFLTSFDEVVTAIFLSGINPTLQKRMWDDLNLEISPTVAAASTLMVGITLLAVLLSAAASRRRGGKRE
jgi:ABC-type spermidine/putrescine transport system permease subunit II